MLLETSHYLFYERTLFRFRHKAYIETTFRNSYQVRNKDRKGYFPLRKTGDRT
jgi:hypothetical protein